MTIQKQVKKNCWLRDVLAVLVAMLGFGLAVLMMIQGELLSYVPGAQSLANTVANARVTEGLMLYFKGLGGAILLSSIAYMMIGQDDTVVTVIEKK